MTNNKMLSNLGLCRRAGKLVLGFDAVTTSVAQGKAYIVLVTKDLSYKTEKEILYRAEKMNIPVYRLPHTMEEMRFLSAKRVGISAVTDCQFAKLIKGSLSSDVELLKEAESL